MLKGAQLVEAKRSAAIASTTRTKMNSRSNIAVKALPSVAGTRGKPRAPYLQR